MVLFEEMINMNKKRSFHLKKQANMLSLIVVYFRLIY